MKLIDPTQPKRRGGRILDENGCVVSRVDVTTFHNIRMQRLDEDGQPTGEPIVTATSGSLTMIERPDLPDCDDDMVIDVGPRSFTMDMELTPETRRILLGDLWTP